MRCKYLDHQVMIRPDGEFRLCCISNEKTNKENIKVFWTNSDHCGDKLCGDVLKNKEILNNNK